MKTDLIVSWPRNCDYPLFREFVRDNRQRFNKVIVVFTETNHGADYREFVRDNMTPCNCLVVDSPALLPGQDWRDVAVNHALGLSNGDVVWFTEQDFIVTNANQFFTAVSDALELVDFVGVMDGDRAHPCSMFVKKEAIEKTGKYFGVGAGLDHFGIFYKELKSVINGSYMIEYNYEHLAGLSHNWRLLADGGEPNYKIDRFTKYLYDSRNASVQLNSHWSNIVNNYFLNRTITVDTSEHNTKTKTVNTEDKPITKAVNTQTTPEVVR